MLEVYCAHGQYTAGLCASQMPPNMTDVLFYCDVFFALRALVQTPRQSEQTSRIKL
jgi:hypothetical protein